MSTRRRVHLITLVGIVALLTASCGTRLEDNAVRAANGAFLTSGGADGSGLGGSGTLDGGGAAGDGSGGGAGTGGVAGTGSGSGGSSNGGGGGGSGGGGGGGSKPEIRLGTFGTASGIIGAQLAAIPAAVRAWAADVNARGGIDGHPIRVIFGGDDGGDPGRAVALARRRGEENKVHALLGTYGGTTGPAVVPYAEDVGIAMVGSVGGTPAEDGSAYVFNPQQATTEGFNRGIPMGLRMLSNARKAAIMYCRESTVCSDGGRIMREYSPRVGVEIVYEAQVSLAQPDFTAEVVSARNAGAEAIMAVIDSNSFIRIARSAHRQGWNPVLACSVACYEETFKSGGSDVEGVIALAGVAPYSVSRKMADYPAAVRKYVPGATLGGTGAGAWVQGKLMERAIQTVRGEITRRSILEALWGLRGETLGGRTAPITFPRNRGRINLCTIPILFTNGMFRATLGEQFRCATDGGIRTA